MFYFIKGNLAYLDPFFAVVEAGGVGYKLTISQNTHAQLSKSVSSDEVILYTHMCVREDGIELIGFASTEEADAFKLLITVSGVGPKAAMSILSLLTPEKFALAVCTDDKKTISKANGIGPKTAARIILDLKDKLMKEHGDAGVSTLPISSPTAKSTGKLQEATDALLVLCYSRAEALAALKDIDTSAIELEEIIRLSLKKLMKY